MVIGKHKGNANEWVVARELSLWLTGGKDKTQLIRSVQSGGHLGMRQAAFFQVGDLAPNGPAGEEFRTYFGIESKAYRDDPEWWHAVTCEDESWIVAKWWLKITEECVPHKLIPLLIMKRNRCPTVVMVPNSLCSYLQINPNFILPRINGWPSPAVITLKRFTSKTPQEWYNAVSSFRGLLQV